MSAPAPLAKKKLQVTGVVQGVGFRPFVYRLAKLHHLAGWVCNTSNCVEIEVEGPPVALEAFIRQLGTEAPALARIDSVVAAEAEPQGHEGFAILDSRALTGTEALIPPDVAACEDCLAEVKHPADRRHRYPFTNCTNCGPRFTIIEAVPYDRSHTTMARFAMCPRCRAEYQDPEDRRFHAEPTACPACGPRVWLEDGDRRLDGDAALKAAARLLRDGKIVAVKGLGGFHLAADARNEAAVAALRERKGRVAKPFALMVRDLAEAERLCLLGDREKSLLLSPERPIVLVPRREPGPIAVSVAPGNKYLGLLLPYTPLHFLLLALSPPALVMTSGNLSEEPLVHVNEEARERLGGLADAFPFHDRDIHVPCDDSVVRPAAGGAVIPIRRARGYVPQSLPLPLKAPQVILGVGAEQKNTFCLAWDRTALLSQHLGDLDSAETFDYYRLAVAHFQALSRKEPEVLAYDLHPLYLSTRYALEHSGKLLVGVQHHHAHLAACLAENGRADKVIGLALDGTGYGPDGTVWGGEILVSGLQDFVRVGRLAQVRLPGGEAAVRDPRRLAAAYLYAMFEEGWQAAAAPLNLGFAPLEEGILARQFTGGLNSPLTSSAGRLFDAVAAALNICRRRTYEGQPAVELEMLALPEEKGCYPVALREEGSLLILDTVALFREVLKDYLAGADPARVATRFHNSLAHLLAAACLKVRERTGLNVCALSGGVFQNARLFTLLKRLLEDAGFEVLYHRLTPPNDGCISLGQAAVSAARLGGRRET